MEAIMAHPHSMIAFPVWEHVKRKHAAQLGPDRLGGRAVVEPGVGVT